MTFLSVTTQGTVAGLKTDDPPGLKPDFVISKIVDPALDTGRGPQGPGVVSAVVLAFTSDVTLPTEGTVRVLRFAVQAPVSPNSPSVVRVFYADGKRGSGEPVRNLATILGTSQLPSLGSCELRLNDCNSNGRADGDDIALGSSQDCSGNGIPDECEPDCNENGKADSCDIKDRTESDCDGNGVLDSCDVASSAPKDCDLNGTLDSCEIADGTAKDCNLNGVPDSCDTAAGVSGDCDADGLLDACEIAAGGTDCNRNGVPDSCDISGGQSQDSDLDGVPDECALACGSPPAPINCPGDGRPVFRYGFRGPCQVTGKAGARVQWQVFAQLETHCLAAGERGAGGWALGIETRDSQPVGVTIDETAAKPAKDGGFFIADIIDPARNGGKTGVVSAVALSMSRPVTLAPEGSPHDVLLITLAGTVPPADDCANSTLEYVDGLAGSGQPVQNFAQWEGNSISVEKSRWAIPICEAGPPPSSLQRPGDGNQDGRLDLSDAIFLLGHLFLGTNLVLPCQGGRLTDPGNLHLFEANGGGAVDLSDAVYLLTFLFLGGPPHVLGKDCAPIVGCPDKCAP